MRDGSVDSGATPPFAEDELLPVSALQHLLFCERRAALVHIEGAWGDNVFTVEGAHLHDRTHRAETEKRGELRVVRGLWLRSLRLGLIGKADVVEFHRVVEAAEPSGVRLDGAGGEWRPVPVEYKRGRLRREEGYEVQLCAQGICLEEMLDAAVSGGAIFFGKTRRRLDVVFDGKLRVRTEEAVGRLRELLAARRTPPARYEKKCEKCSLLPACMPKVTGGRRSAAAYVSAALDAARAPIDAQQSPGTAIPGLCDADEGTER